MPEARQSEFSVLQERAYEALENVAPPKPSAILLLKLAVYPAFFNFASWAVFSHANNSTSLLVRQTIWDRLSDSHRFFDPMEGLRKGWHTSPNLSVVEKDIDKTAFAILFDKAEQIIIPFETNPPLVLDGERWYLHIPSLFEGRNLTWNSGPAEWKELIQWADEMRALLATASDLGRIYISKFER